VTALFCVASACSNGPAPNASLHPPASDLRVWAHNDLLAPAGACTTEPPAPDPDNPATTREAVEAWQIDVLLSGRGCRDTVARICAWHRDNGATDLAAYCPRP
jgi:hypothetical protein